MTAHARSPRPFYAAESLMAASGIALAVLGAVVLGLVLASDGEHGVGNWSFAWLAPLASLLFLAPAGLGAAIMPKRAWTGGLLVMANTLALLIGAAAATSVIVPLGLVYLPAVVLLWRAASRSIARRGAEEIVPGPRPYLVWASGGLAAILAFLLIASRLYETCRVSSGGLLDCRTRSLGEEGLVLSLIGAVVVGLMVAAAMLLAARPRHRHLPRQRWLAALPAAAALAGFAGLVSPLPVIGLLALALVVISLISFFLPTQTRARIEGRS